jgi:hypothetical protein
MMHYNWNSQVESGDSELGSLDLRIKFFAVSQVGLEIQDGRVSGH